jgi:hypothetical protein
MGFASEPPTRLPEALMRSKANDRLSMLEGCVSHGLVSKASQSRSNAAAPQPKHGTRIFAEVEFRVWAAPCLLRVKIRRYQRKSASNEIVPESRAVS